MTKRNREPQQMGKTEQNSDDIEASDQDGIFDVKHLEADIKRHSIRGGAITLFAHGAKVFLMFGGLVVLARLLSPKDFGLLAMVTSITAFAVIFKDMGLSTATVQKSEINQGQISVLFWVNTCVGLITMFVVAAMAPVIARFYYEPRLTHITLVLSITFFLGGLSVQHQALLRRQMRFGVLALIQTISTAVSIATGIIIALCGAGYWALVFMPLVMSGTTAIGFLTTCRWRPGLPVRGSGVRPMLLFGGHITGSSIIHFFSRNLDKILIGRLCGDGMLGLYSESHKILNVPISNLRAPVNAVAIPALSRLQNDPDRYKRFYSQLLLVLALISMPVLAFLGVCAENVILVVLGDQWVEMSGIFRMLVVAGFMQAVAGTRGLVLISCGQTGRYLKWGIISSMISICAIAIGIPWGALGVATVLAFTRNLELIPSLWYSFRYTPVTIGTFFKSIWRSMAASIVMGAALFFFSFSFVSPNVFIQTFLSLLFGFVVFILAWFAIPGGAKELKRLYAFTSFLLPNRRNS